MDWFLYDRDLRHEGVKICSVNVRIELMERLLRLALKTVLNKRRPTKPKENKN